jgi:hypothetical protein
MQFLILTLSLVASQAQVGLISDLWLVLRQGVRLDGQMVNLDVSHSVLLVGLG